MASSDTGSSTHPPQTVLQISNNHFVAGGSDRYYLELSRALHGDGIEVIPFAPEDSRNESSEWSPYFPTAPDAGNAKISDTVRFIYSRAASESLSRLLERRDVQLAHCHIYYGRITASILPVLKNAGIPVVQTLHEYKLICPVYTCLRNGRICEDCHGHKFWKAAKNRCNRRSFIRSLASATESYVSKWLGSHSSIGHFIAVSEFQRNRMIANSVCEPAKITTVHNFVDTSRYAAARGVGSYICYFGRIEKLKGLATLMAAMRRLPDVRLIMIGDGGFRPECEKLISENRIGNVEITGFQSGDALADLIRGSICTVLPSEWYENCPMSLLESFAYARPVVGTDIGGIPELIDDAVDGYIVPIARADALADAIGKLASDREMAVSMGRAGRKKLEREFSRDVHVRRIREIYERVLRKTAHG